MCAIGLGAFWFAREPSAQGQRSRSPGRSLSPPHAGQCLPDHKQDQGDGRHTQRKSQPDSVPTSVSSAQPSPLSNSRHISQVPNSEAWDARLLFSVRVSRPLVFVAVGQLSLGVSGSVEG
jgi:hypothetical protein